MLWMDQLLKLFNGQVTCFVFEMLAQNWDSCNVWPRRWPHQFVGCQSELISWKFNENFSCPFHLIYLSKVHQRCVPFIGVEKALSNFEGRHTHIWWCLRSCCVCDLIRSRVASWVTRMNCIICNGFTTFDASAKIIAWIVWYQCHLWHLANWL